MIDPRITSVELHNIRGFSNLKIPLQASDRERKLGMVTAIIGKNGTCKSTLLRCIALGLVRDLSDAAALLSDAPGGLVSNEATSASVRVEFGTTRGKRLGHTKLKLGKSRGRDKLVEFSRELDGLDDIELFACGYGPGRSLAGASESEHRSFRTTDSLISLFDYRTTMQNPELMLRRLEDHLGEAIYVKAMHGLRRILGLKGRQKIEIAKGGGVCIKGPGLGDGIRIEGWADGYRMTTTWLLDFYGWAIQADAIRADGRVSGILLVDEIEQHLHPAMQTNLLTSLRKALPDVQIIATTHSPLTALGAGAENLVSLHRRGKSVVVEPIPDTTSLSVEDAITMPELFDTSAYPERTSKLIDEYRDLIRKGPKNRSKKESLRMRHLARQLDAGTLPEMGGGDLDQRRTEMRKYLEAELGNP